MHFINQNLLMNILKYIVYRPGSANADNVEAWIKMLREPDLNFREKRVNLHYWVKN